MRTLYTLIVVLIISTNVFAQSKTLYHSLEKLRAGYVLSAVTEFRNDANRGDVWAQFFLGICYERGYGVNQDLQEAFRLYRKTAENGLAIGQHNVANCYRKGIGTSQNMLKAEYWEKKAENRYNPELLTLLDIYFKFRK